MTRVSILTVCKDGAETLGRCLDGVAAQEWPGLEHVVQDGVSTDGTADLLRAHAGRVDLQLVSEPDDGIHDAVVRALRRSTGDIVGFSWADEALLPGAVQHAVAAFEARPELGALYGTVIETDEMGRDQKVRTWPDWSFGEVFLYRLVPPVCAAFFRRRALEELFLPAALVAGDCFEWLLWVTVGARHPVQRIPETLARYAQHPGQLSRQPDVVDEYPARLSRSIDALTAGGLLSPELAARTAVVKSNVHLWAMDWLAGDCDDLMGGARHLRAALTLDTGAVRASAVPWGCACRLLGRGEAAWVVDALDGMTAAGASNAGANLLRALGRAQLGDEQAARAIEGLLVRVSDGPAVADAIAKVIEELAGSGRKREAERSLDVLRRLARLTSTWHLALALVLGELGQWDEALALLRERDESDEGASEWRELRMQLQLQLCTRDPAVRMVIGEIAGRDAAIEPTEARSMARELARIVGGRTAGSATAAPSEGLAMVATVVMVEADRLGFRALAEQVGTFAARVD
jgi:hypothetical protein